jgi:type IV fimbrial biogenesis protein FimT
MLDHEKGRCLLNAIPKTRPCGFSLIELLISVAVLAILVSLAVPGFRVWIKNAEIRNAAESIQNGLQLARAQALLRNTNVEFTLLDADGSSWEVRLAGGGALIEKRSSNEGSVEVKRAVLPNPVATTVTFNNVGSVVSPNSDGTSPFTSVTLDSTALPAADSHELTVVIGVGGVGGTVRMCDPNISSGPRAC